MATLSSSDCSPASSLSSRTSSGELGQELTGDSESSEAELLALMMSIMEPLTLGLERTGAGGKWEHGGAGRGRGADGGGAGQTLAGVSLQLLFFLYGGDHCGQAGTERLLLD